MLALVPVRSLSWRMLKAPPSPRFASALISAADRFRSVSAALSACSVRCVARCNASTTSGSPVSDITEMDYMRMDYLVQSDPAWRHEAQPGN